MFETVKPGCVTVFVELGSSAAFYTINQTVAAKKFKHMFGVNGTALSWLESSLNSRFSFVKILDASSTTAMSDTGVPQGFCLGPLLFPLFTILFDEVNARLVLKCHQNADDTQIHLAVDTEK